MSKITPPEGFIFDDRTGYYYTQEIEENKEGKFIQHVVWFDPETGEFTDNYYDIPDDSDNTYVEGVNNADEFDEEFEIQNQDMFGMVQGRKQTSSNSRLNNSKAGRKKDTKSLPIAAIIGIIGAIVLVIVIIVVVLALKNNTGSDKTSKKGNDMATESSSNEEGFEYGGVAADTKDYVKTSNRSPLDCNISDYNVVFQSPNDNGYLGMIVYGVGDMSGDYLVNLAGHRTGEPLYSWDFFLSDKVGIRVYGLADCERSDEPIYVSGSEYLKAAIISREGDSISVLEEMQLYTSQDGFNLDRFDIRKYDESIIPSDVDTIKIVTMLGDYGQNGEIVSNIFAEDGSIIENSENYYNEDSVMTDGVVEEVSMDEQGMGSGVDLHSSGMAGFRHSGGFECTDQSLPADYRPRIILEDDGYCELYANLGDGFYKLQGYYEYKSSGSEYDDQGGETYIYMHFPGNSEDLSYAEILYDSEIDDGYIYFLTGGFGLMGGDGNFAGYFARIY